MIATVLLGGAARCPRCRGWVDVRAITASAVFSPLYPRRRGILQRPGSPGPRQRSDLGCARPGRATTWLPPFCARRR